MVAVAALLEEGGDLLQLGKQVTKELVACAGALGRTDKELELLVSRYVAVAAQPNECTQLAMADDRKALKINLHPTARPERTGDELAFPLFCLPPDFPTFCALMNCRGSTPAEVTRLLRVHSAPICGSQVCAIGNRPVEVYSGDGVSLTVDRLYVKEKLAFANTAPPSGEPSPAAAAAPLAADAAEQLMDSERRRVMLRLVKLFVPAGCTADGIHTDVPGSQD